MDDRGMQELDALIERSLRDEQMRAVPAGFHNRLNERLKVAAIVERERHRVRYGAMAGVFLFGMLGITLLFAPVMSYLQGWLVRSVPGGMGYLDYIVVSLLNTSPVWARTSAVVLACGIGLGLIVSGTRVIQMRMARNR
ncbi:MAG: hypothetical protein JXR94_23055 [Candidatus Hydrogenedentes bacterium]|nr:hypothetical protein [Candidatus Hydrogenedentota bacterium]